jgi:hypothetical protein
MWKKKWGRVGREKGWRVGTGKKGYKCEKSEKGYRSRKDKIENVKEEVRKGRNVKCKRRSEEDKAQEKNG